MSVSAKKAAEAERFEMTLDAYRAGKQLKSYESLTGEQRKERRRIKRALHDRRSAILKRIDQLDAERCIQCHKETIGPAERKLGCRCWAATNIQLLSEVLDRLARLGKSEDEEGDDEVSEKKSKSSKSAVKTGSPKSGSEESTPNLLRIIETHRNTIEDLNAKAERQEKMNTALQAKADDYERLAEDYRIVTEENELLSRMLDRLKDTAQMNVWLMRQHIGFVEQLEEVTP